MKTILRYFGIVTLGLMVLGCVIGMFRGTIHPLHALFTLVVMYYLFVATWFAIRYLFWFDELREEFDRKAGERIAPRDRFTREILTCWHGSTPQATRIRRRYNILAIFSILSYCSVFVYGLLAYLAFGLFGGSSGGSGDDGKKTTPANHRRCENCRWGTVDGCELAGGGNRAGDGGSCSRWQPRE